MSYKPRYLEKQRVSRGPRSVGELFAIKFRGMGYLFGRVVRENCGYNVTTKDPRLYSELKGVYLLYVYAEVAQTLDTVPSLSPKRLITPPMLMFGFGWTLGYFLKIRVDVLTERDVLRVHCFYRTGRTVEDIENGRRASTSYYNEHGEPLSRRYNPCREMGYEGLGSFENEIARAFGLPLVEF